MSISAIIPAYNEENTIGGILKTLKNVQAVHEIIVVSDGSTDGTAYIARQTNVKVIELPQNKGKGAAVKAGVQNCLGEIIVLLDADLIGLNEQHIVRMIKPVLEDEADMVIGIFKSGRLRTDLAQKLCPFLSGQRVLKKSLLDDISDMDKIGYGMEVVLSAYGDSRSTRVKEVELENITHVMKEEKLGILRGFAERLRMYWQIYRGIRLSRR